jgi:acetyl-CoA carboxylase biotin carboxyl carrier protein
MAKGTAKKPSGGVDLVEVERLLAFMEKHGLEELEYASGGVHVHLKKASTALLAAPRAVEASAPASPTPHPALAGGHARAPGAAVPADVHVVKSPIVGTFYASPSPNADPFVTVGARVEPGQALCIIEAMKLMNEIEADMAGEIVQIFVENGKPVEYGEPLFGIRPGVKK